MVGGDDDDDDDDSDDDELSGLLPHGSGHFARHPMGGSWVIDFHQ